MVYIRIFALPECYAQRKLVVGYRRFGIIRRLSRNISNYLTIYAARNIPEEPTLYLHHNGNLKSCKVHITDTFLNISPSDLNFILPDVFHNSYKVQLFQSNTFFYLFYIYIYIHIHSRRHVSAL